MARPSALRIAFTLSGEAWAVSDVSVIRVGKPPQPGATGPWDASTTGALSIRIVDARGDTRFHKGFPDPREVEYPTGDPDRPFANASIDNVEKVYVVLIPDFPEAKTVEIWRRPLGDETLPQLLFDGDLPSLLAERELD